MTYANISAFHSQFFTRKGRSKKSYAGVFFDLKSYYQSNYNGAIFLDNSYFAFTLNNMALHKRPYKAACMFFSLVLLQKKQLFLVLY